VCASTSDAPSETPLYDGLVKELGDPEKVARGIDEWAILWHADRMRQTPGAPAG
jgi:hypothetical protein